MITAHVRELFRELCALRFGEGKPDSHENLLDVLELMAVALGRKPAHLQGHGQYDQATLAAIEALAAKHGLLVRRTPGFDGLTHRPYRGDREFQAFMDGRERNGEWEVLWVYRDAPLTSAIDEVVHGQRRPGEVLGYPECCERAYTERALQVLEALERGYREQHGAVTTAELIECAKQDRPVSVEADPDKGLIDLIRAYPFVQFIACSPCARSKGSAAEKLNNGMRILARDLDPSFAKAISLGKR
jgi:hypothetical protein